MAREVERDQQVAPGQVPDAVPEMISGPGVSALEALIKQGVPPVTKVIELIDRHRAEHDAIILVLQNSLGNRYVQEMQKAMAAIRVDLKRKEVVAGDPGNPSGGYFLADTKSANWMTADQRFEGQADKTGGRATYKLDEDDSLVAGFDSKAKTGSLGWQHEGKTMGELYGRSTGNGEWDAGLRREFATAGGAVITPMLRHHATPQGGQAEVAVDYSLAGAESSTKASAYAGVREDGSGPVAGASALHEFEPGRSIAGAAKYGPDGYKLSMDGKYRINPEMHSSLRLEREQGATSGHAALAYDAGGLHLDGSVAHRRPDSGPSQTTLAIHEAYKSSRVVQSFNVEAGIGAENYQTANASIEAQLAPNLYGGAWGSATSREGKGVDAMAGASLTFTASEKTALTLAGVMNSAGQVEARLQYDVFKSRINNISDLSANKKAALLSLFVSVSNGTGGHLMDDRFGGSKFSRELNEANGNSPQVTMGINFRF